jgi:hypothetical protein
MIAVAHLIAADSWEMAARARGAQIGHYSG